MRDTTHCHHGDSATGDAPDWIEYVVQREEIGLLRTLADMAHEPRDPFKPWERRRWKKGFLLAALTTGAWLAWFAWFSFLS